MRCAGRVARVGQVRNTQQILIRIPEEKIPLGRSKRRWDDNIKMDLKWNVGVWAGLHLFRVGSSCGLL